MSKEKPEVGDVWRSIGCKKHILFVSENAVRCLIIGGIGCHTKILVQSIDVFMRISTYLGKSKVSIKELFDTVNDNVKE